MPEVLRAFHFAEPGWLWALLLLAPVALWISFSQRASDEARLRRYADPGLLPYLLRTPLPDARRRWRSFVQWAALWTLAVLAMAGPRWDFSDVQLFSPGASLVVLFDISRSMEVGDVRPSRLARARQEVEDLLEANRSARIGLVAFASVAHVVAPITEDTRTIHRLLPALSPELVNLQGTHATFALQRGAALLAGQSEATGKSMLLISDGDFIESDLLDQVAALAAQGIRVHVLGVGTPEGGPVPAPGGGWVVAPDGQRVISRLNEDGLQALAQAGDGIYRRADFRAGDTRAILAEVEASGSAQALGGGRTRIWHERFYWLLVPALVLLLMQFRRRRQAVVEGAR